MSEFIESIKNLPWSDYAEMSYLLTKQEVTANIDKQYDISNLNEKKILANFTRCIELACFLDKCANMKITNVESIDIIKFVEIERIRKQAGDSIKELKQLCEEIDDLLKVIG